MKKCPKCKKEISYLIYVEETRKDATFENMIDGFKYHSEEETTDSCFECPECRQIIAGNEAEAKDFLRGGKQ